jgi:putative hydrolase of the HAD superfamily
MKYQAVVFDLFGTLVDNPSVKERVLVFKQIAGVLNVSPGDFLTLWDETMNQRDIGYFQCVEDNFKYIGQRTGVHFTEAQIKQASKMRWDWAKSLMKPRKQAVEVLSSLKSQNYKIGLLSDCSI